MHPFAARALAGLLALGAVVALLGAHGLVAAVLGALAWFALPADEGGSLVAVQRRRRTARRAPRL